MIITASVAQKFQEPAAGFLNLGHSTLNRLLSGTTPSDKKFATPQKIVAIHAD